MVALIGTANPSHLELIAMGTPDRSDRRAADSAPTSVGPDDSDLEEPAKESEYQAVCDEILAPKQACNRCRRRKIRCNRAKPCSNCVRYKSECTYPSMAHHREKRQRIHVSEQYEHKINQIFKILDELSVKVDNLSNESITSTGSTQGSSAEAILNSSADHDETTPFTGQFEEEPSFLNHALFASQILNGRICESNSSNGLVRKMTSALDKLREVIDSQKRQKGTLKALYPHARHIPHGSSLDDLPVPPVEINLECLQKARESQHVRFFWLSEFVSLSHFTEYLVNVYSPGPTSNNDLIIVLGGIFWLFCECALEATNKQTQEKYWKQATICRETLETILCNLPFHAPVGLDSALAMSVAASYCFRSGKLSAAWNFITHAAHLCQMLGFHNPHVLRVDCQDLKQRKVKLLWSVYILERTLSFHFGRPSTFNDNDIALPRLGVSLDEPTMDFPFNVTLTKHIHIADIQGRVYNGIYSLKALSQPMEIRASYARNLACELASVLEHEDEFEKKYNEARRRALGPAIHELFLRAARISELSLLTLLYRCIPPEKPFNAAFCDECFAAARAALEEHQRSVSIIASSRVKGHPLEFYINWSFLLFPFFPFIVHFSHAVQTCEKSDLYLLKSVVETLESISESAFYQTCGRKIRLFRALYDVAENYIELKTNESEQQIANSDFNQMLTTIGVPILPQSSTSLPRSNYTESDDRVTGPHAASHDVTSSFGFGTSVTGAFTTDLDEMSLELGNWFQGNHEMLRLLDDSYLRQ